MPVRLTPRVLLAAGTLLASGVQAQAALIVSHGQTSHVACVAGACRATAPDAVLNAAALQSMLSSGPMTLSADAGARDVVINARLRWLHPSVLTIAAAGPVVIAQPVQVAGYGGGLAISSAAKSGSYLVFAAAGALSYAQPQYGTLTINGTAYQLVSSVAGLAAAAAANPSGAYALAASYDARPDGTYAAAPVAQPFMGSFEGLGNSIAHLSVSSQAAGLFANLFYGASVRDLKLSNASVTGGTGAIAGILAASSNAGLARIQVSGSVTVGAHGAAGGLAGQLDSATALHCASAVHVNAGDGGTAGGLVGQALNATLQQSYTLAEVSAGAGGYAAGLAGTMSRSAAIDSYARGLVSTGTQGYAGGITAYLGGSSTHTSYSVAHLSGDATVAMGGLVGANSSAPPPNTSIIDTAYWDVVTSGQRQGVGAGPSGGTGMTTTQFRQGLPQGFDTAVWGSKPTLNDGLPYLLAMPAR